VALTPFIDVDDLIARVQLSEVVRYSRGTGETPNEDNVDEAILIATDRFRVDAAKVYTLASIDALTAETVPATVRYYLSWYAIDVLAGGSKKPEHVEVKIAEAKTWLSFLATGNLLFDILVKIGADVSGGALVSRRNRSVSVFSRAVDGATSTSFDTHDPYLP
jgi:hypothetical protein